MLCSVEEFKKAKALDKTDVIMSRKALETIFDGMSGGKSMPDYMGAQEKMYMTGEIHRAVRLGIKIKNCVQIKNDYIPIAENTTFHIGDIMVEAIPTSGHTVGPRNPFRD